MAGFVAGKFSDNSTAELEQITDRVEDLVAHEFIAISQTVGIQNFVVVYNNRVIDCLLYTSPSPRDS